LRRRITWRVPPPLDVAAMAEAARGLEGHHDFRAFRASGGSARTTWRTVERLEVRSVDDEVWITCRGGGFLYRMVRVIVGSLVEVGRGRVGVEGPSLALASGRRQDAGPTAPPHGLCLTAVDYGLTGPFSGPYPH
jgi:tRNA pseudouridine38-40 synthase